MTDHSNPAKHSLANRFRPRPREILIATPGNQIRRNPFAINNMIFSNRNKKTPSPRVLTYNLSFAFPSPAKGPTRSGSISRSGVQRGICFAFFPIRQGWQSRSASQRGISLLRRVVGLPDGVAGQGFQSQSSLPPANLEKYPSRCISTRHNPEVEFRATP
jgi:hypothetical protein